LRDFLKILKFRKFQKNFFENLTQIFIDANAMPVSAISKKIFATNFWEGGSHNAHLFPRADQAG